MSKQGRKYSDEEFALILRKASELQARPSGSEGDVGGISLEEIRAIAQEVGIDPAAVDRVAAMLPTEEHSGAIARLMGGSTKYRLEHTARGRVSEADLARLLDAVRRAAGTHGKVEYGPLGFEWSGGDGGGWPVLAGAPLTLSGPARTLNPPGRARPLLPSPAGGAA